MSNPQTEFDSPWKDIIERYFQDFILFFCLQADGEIEWNRGFEFLDKELQQVVRDAELGRRLADKLVKVWRTGGEEAWVLIHLEVQSQEETNFSERMFVYYYRIYDRYRRRVASIAVLGDESSGWRPNQFSSELWGSKILFEFSVVKLLELEQDFWREVRKLEEELRMPYITSVERIGIQKGIEQSREQMRQVLLESLELGLQLKFGTQGLGLFSEISRIDDVEQLRAIQIRLKTVQTLEELRQMYQRSN